MTDTLNQLSAEITALTGLWMRLINVDSHKDRDCHWSIETVFSYGEPPKFHVYHEGYVYKRISFERPTMASALTGLRDELKRAIKSQEEWALGAIQEDDYMNATDAHSVLQILKEVNNG